MIISQTKELMGYIAYENGRVILKKSLPEELRQIYEEYKQKYEDARTSAILSSTLVEFASNPRDVAKEDFIKTYGNERMFRLMTFDEEEAYTYAPGNSEGVYFSYEDAVSALMMRNVSCPVGEWSVVPYTIAQIFEDPGTIRLIRPDGRIVSLREENNELLATGYVQSESLEHLVSKYAGQTVAIEDLKEDMFNLDDIILWVLARPDAGKWHIRVCSPDDTYGGYCHIYSTYKEAEKESYFEHYPQKTTLYQELTNCDYPHILHHKGKEVKFIPENKISNKENGADSAAQG